MEKQRSIHPMSFIGITPELPLPEGAQVLGEVAGEKLYAIDVDGRPTLRVHDNEGRGSWCPVKIVPSHVNGEAWALSWKSAPANQLSLYDARTLSEALAAALPFVEDLNRKAYETAAAAFQHQENERRAARAEASRYRP